MNVKKYVIASVVVFVAFEIMDYIVHTVILGGAYRATAALWRPEQEMRSMMWIMWLVTLVFSFVFVYIYSKGYEGKGLGEGVRFGFWIGLLTAVPMAFASYVIYPMPFSIAIQWFIYAMIERIIGGVIVAALYKPEPAAA